MPRSMAARLIFSLILLYTLGTGLLGLTTKGVQSWDEGTYYTEARFVHQTTRAAVYLLWGKLLPGAGYPDLAALKETVNGLPPSMGRPLNTAVNTLGLYVLGEQPWVPALLAVGEGVGCVWLVFVILRRIGSERAGLLAAGLLALSAYFLPYRRLGMCEAGGALAALGVVWYLVRSGGRGEVLRDAQDGTPNTRWRRQSWWLGVLCGLAFGMNTRTLLLLPAVVVWRAWQTRRAGGGENLGEQWWAQALRVIGGFALMIALYQAPYVILEPIAGRLGYQFEDYLAQMQRFATAQSQLGRVGLDLAYGAPAYFFLRNEGPVVLLFVLGLFAILGRRRAELTLLPMLLVLPLLQTAALIPYARYQSWLLPVFAMIAAVGLESVWQRVERHSRPVAAVLAAAVLVVCGGYGVYRGAPVLAAQSRQAEALRWCHDQGAKTVLTTNLGAAYAQSTLYDLQHLQYLPTEPGEARRVVAQRAAEGPVRVIVETQQFMRSELLMSPEEYERSTAALLWRQPPVCELPAHLRGLFPFACFEHNRLLPVTLQMLREYGDEAQRLRIYTGENLVQTLP